MVSIPRGKIEWNLNTILQLISIVGFLASAVVIYTNKSRDVEDLSLWKNGHEALHRERQAEIKSNEARADERMRGLEKDLQDFKRIGENLTYRVTMSEQSMSGISEAVRRLQDTVGRQGSDIRLALEILQRMEGRTVKPTP